ncbi:hypothetical protein Mp_5g19000 [Marchantia polymorpha subsp. ruderalis]|uniref:Uncharacterized protein n=2 Tax=Marchantia polymorpha TaxID=3197 RepID=A0AAF6BJX4_MARPO|nr:hypothetical protein MARPO_0073s0043 [Marchantia polymorpha]BBN12308.1 hypothetical protein Mp_5g19000 [Marchantia polymorpha subsp. ruderalis]|eukprot:PTQ35169.1 hypothetical protein MARPO_0073s0043 [Marchantia polymorpha]
MWARSGGGKYPTERSAWGSADTRAELSSRQAERFEAGQGLLAFVARGRTPAGTAAGRKVSLRRTVGRLDPVPATRHMTAKRQCLGTRRIHSISIIISGLVHDRGSEVSQCKREKRREKREEEEEEESAAEAGAAEEEEAWSLKLATKQKPEASGRSTGPPGREKRARIGL